MHRLWLRHTSTFVRFSGFLKALLVAALTVACALSHALPPETLDEISGEATPNQVPNSDVTLTPEFQNLSESPALQANSPNEDENQNERPPPAGFFIRKQSLAVRLGGIYSSASEKSWTYGLGVLYSFPRLFSPYPEIGADIVASYSGHFHLALRHFLIERNAFRPYFLYGLTHELDSDARLATFTNLKNYYARGAVGLEDWIHKQMSVRLELQGLMGTERHMVGVWLGYSWLF